MEIQLNVHLNDFSVIFYLMRRFIRKLKQPCLNYHLHVILMIIKGIIHIHSLKGCE